MKCLICDSSTNLKNTICDNCLDLFEANNSSSDLKLKWVDEVYSVYKYNRLLKKIILSYKFANKRYYSKIFGELLCDYIVENRLYRDMDMTISVPLHIRTLNKRGFNQVEEIENIIGENLPIEMEKDNLIKAKFTREQARLDSKERKNNLKGAFKLKSPLRIKGKNILLLDDLITSGNTVDSCGQVLKAGGCGKIIALSIASGS